MYIYMCMWVYTHSQTCLHMYVCVCMYVCMYVSAYLCVYFRLQAGLCVYVYVCVRACVCISVFKLVCVCSHKCLHACVCEHMCVIYISNVIPFPGFPCENPLFPPPYTHTNPPTPASWPWHSPTLGHRAFTGPRASSPIDDRLGHTLLHMELEP